MDTPPCEFLDRCEHQWFWMSPMLRALRPMCLIARDNCVIRRERLAKEATNHD